MDRCTRLELLKRARWCRNNIGFAGRCIDGTARYVCGTGLMPIPMGGDPAWNKKARALFDNWASFAPAFDMAGAVNFYESQQLLIASMLEDGAAYAVTMREPGQLPRMRFIGSQSLGNGTDPVAAKPGSGWVDGKKLDAYGRCVLYRFVENNEGTKWKDVPSDYVVEMSRTRRPGQVHAPSALHHAVNNLLDISEILQYEKHSVKINSQIAYWLKTPFAAGAGPKLNLPGTTSTRSETDDGVAIIKSKLSSSAIVAEMPGGVEMHMLKSDRPSVTFQGFLDYLCRDISWGIGISPEILWAIAGIGGANTRYVMADAQVFFESQQELLVNRYLTRYYRYFTWHAIELGQLENPGENWAAVDWTYPAKFSVDTGREGKLYADLVDGGKMSRKRYFGQIGLDDEQEDIEMVQSYKRRMELCAAEQVDPDKVFPNTKSAAQAMPPPAPAGPPDPDETDPPAPAKKP